MAEELKPCPFCGGGAVVREIPLKSKKLARYYPICYRCMTSGDNYMTYEEAVNAWNRRTNEQKT